MYDLDKKYRKLAAETLPAGFGFIYSGDLRAGDIVFDWIDREWLAYESPLWTQTTERAENCVAAARSGRSKPFETPTTRKYSISTFRPAQSEPANDKPVTAQPSLFSD